MDFNMTIFIADVAKTIFGAELETFDEEVKQIDIMIAKVKILRDISLGLEVALILTSICCFFLAAFHCTSIMRLTLLLKCATLTCSRSVSLPLLVGALYSGTIATGIVEFLEQIFINWHQCLTLVFLHAVHVRILEPLMENGSLKFVVRKSLLAFLALMVVTGVEKGLVEMMNYDEDYLKDGLNNNTVRVAKE